MNQQPLPMPVASDGAFSSNPTFAAVAKECAFLRERQRVVVPCVYSLSGHVDCGSSQVFTLAIEQGSDFRMQMWTGSAFSYVDVSTPATEGTDFPLPNVAGSIDWAGRGLEIYINDTRTGRDLTNGYVPFECLFSPGYGLNYQCPMPFKYLFLRNTKIKVDVRNVDAATHTLRNHRFSIALIGEKYFSPEQAM